MQFKEEILVHRTELLINGLLTDPVFMKKYGISVVKKIKAHMFTYTALHAVMAGNKRESLQYLILGWKTSVNEIFKKRSGAIIKKILFS